MDSALLVCASHHETTCHLPPPQRVSQIAVPTARRCCHATCTADHTPCTTTTTTTTTGRCLLLRQHAHFSATPSLSTAEIETRHVRPSPGQRHPSPQRSPDVHPHCRPHCPAHLDVVKQQNVGHLRGTPAARFHPLQQRWRHTQRKPMQCGRTGRERDQPLYDR